MKDSPLYIAILDKCVELMMVGSEGERETEREGGRERDRERETERDRERQRETERDRKKETERGLHIHNTYRAMLVLTYFLLYIHFSFPIIQCNAVSMLFGIRVYVTC